MSFIVPGRSLPVSFTQALVSRMGKWSSNTGTKNIDLLDGVIQIENQRGLGKPFEMYFTYPTTESYTQVRRRSRFIGRYHNWPILINGTHGTFLQAVDWVVGQRLVRLRFSNTPNSSTADAPFLSGTLTFSSVTTVVAMAQPRVISNPPGSADPTLLWPPSTLDGNVTLYSTPAPRDTEIIITEHSLADEVKSPDGTLLLSTTEAVEGTIPVEGGFLDDIGGVVTLLGEEYILKEMIRTDTHRAHVRLEREVT